MAQEVAPDTRDGAPLRLVSPSQYGYVSTKHLSRVEVWTSEPPQNFSYVHRLGRFVLIPPLVWRHPRGRVWHEERNRHLPAWIMRVLYPPARPPLRWLSALGSESRRKKHGP